MSEQDGAETNPALLDRSRVDSLFAMLCDPASTTPRSPTACLTIDIPIPPRPRPARQPKQRGKSRRAVGPEQGELQRALVLPKNPTPPESG